MVRSFGLVAVLWLGCSRTVDAPSYPDPVPLGASHVVEVSTRSDVSPPPDRRARYQMRQQRSDLKYVEDLLVEGRLDEARPLADQLAPDHGAALQATDAAQGADGSRATDTPPTMMHATSIAQASRIAAQITAGCGSCHQRVGAHVAFEDGPAPPEGDGSRCSPRHRWAIGRLADGLTSARDLPWRAGLYAFATTPMTGPGSPQHQRVQEIARAALAHVASDTLDGRAAVYSDLLATCGSCHAAAREERRHGAEVL
jgi:cytochrome c553